MTCETIAKTVSEILRVNYNHHDLHYADYGFKKKHSLLTAYEGMSPFTFSILEDGTIYTPIRMILELENDLSEKLKRKINDAGFCYSLKDILDAEMWLKENDAIAIIIDNLSDFYKELMQEQNHQSATN